jgi:hypothetical protein
MPTCNHCLIQASLKPYSTNSAEIEQLVQAICSSHTAQIEQLLLLLLAEVY